MAICPRFRLFLQRHRALFSSNPLRHSLSLGITCIATEVKLLLTRLSVAPLARAGTA